MLSANHCAFGDNNEATVTVLDQMVILVEQLEDASKMVDSC